MPLSLQPLALIFFKDWHIICDITIFLISLFVKTGTHWLVWNSMYSSSWLQIHENSPASASRVILPIYRPIYLGTGSPTVAQSVLKLLTMYPRLALNSW